MNVPEVVCAGFSVLDVLVNGIQAMPSGGRTEFVDDICFWPGGDAMNQATILSKMGHAVSLVSLIGKDRQGDLLLENCRTHGIDTRALAVTEDTATTTSIVLIEKETGERSCITPKDACIAFMGPEHVDMSVIVPGVKVVSIGSLFASGRFDLEALPALLKKAKDVGAVTCADMVANLSESSLADYAEIIPLLDYIMPSQDEAKLFTKAATADEAADQLLAYGAKNVVIKLQSEGAFVKNSAARKLFGVYPAKVLDTTGAGDNFVSGFISGLLHGYALEDSVSLGCAAASLSIRTLGASTGVTSFAQVDALRASKSVLHTSTPDEILL